MENIEQELMKLEFRHKKDIAEAEQRSAEAEKRSNEWYERMQTGLDEIRAIQKQTQLHLNHITKLTGISFEKFADIESRIENDANALKPQAESK